jgi:hypothetical protein
VVVGVSDGMTRAERQELARLARLRAKQAKTEVDQRAQVLLAEVEDLMTAEFDSRDELWAQAIATAEQAARDANELIFARCAELGVPKKYAPTVSTYFLRRSPDFVDPARRAELRKLAQTKLKGLTATAKTMIDQKALDAETALIAGGLKSAEARAFLESIPTAEQLMPALTLDDIGVKHWQPPDGAAAQLVTPSTTADRKRRQIRRAIEANPDASNRRIAELTGVDHKTVAKYRERGETSGEIVGEIPTSTGKVTDDDDGGDTP